MMHMQWGQLTTDGRQRKDDDYQTHKFKLERAENDMKQHKMNWKAEVVCSCVSYRKREVVMDNVDSENRERWKSNVIT